VTTHTMDKCRNADRYAGIRFPRCNSGNPCKACLLKYAQVHSGFPTQHTPHVAANKPVCACGYDQRIAGAFDRMLELDDQNKLSGPSTVDCLKAMGHTAGFPAMISTIAEDPATVWSVMADAVRYSMAIGRRLQELENLEEMVGYKEAMGE
jgi:hypothetical protein